MDNSISLRELVDVDIVQAIQDSFAKTVGVSSVIFLPDGDALTRFSNPIKFCSLIQSTKEGRRRCFQSFAEMSRKAVELSEPEIMYCFAHGAHFVAPIIIDGERKATMYAGQFRPDKFSPEQLKELEKIAVEIDLNPELLVKEAKNMRTVGDAMVWDCLHSFFRTVKGIAELGAQAVELRQTKDALQKAHDELEMRVQKRTSELAETNEELRQEVAERKVAEDALRRSESRYRDLFDNMMDGLVVHRLIVNEDGKPIDYVLEKINNAAERILSWKMADMEGKRATEVYGGDTPFIKRYARVARTGESVHFVEYCPRFKRWYEITSFCPMPGYFANVFRDITKRVRAEKTLHKYEQIVSATKDHMAFLGRDYVYQSVNDAYLQAHQKTRQEILGCSVAELLGDDVFEKQVKNRLDRCLAGEEIHYPAWFDFPMLGRRYMAVSYYPFFGVDGEILGVVVSSHDTTKRKQAEDALQKSEEKLRSIAEQSGDGIVLVDEEGTIIEWNRGHERITGLSREDVLGRPVWDIMFRMAANEPDNPALYKRIKAGVLNIIETGQSGLDRLEEREIRRPDGVRRVIQAAVFPIKTGKGFMAGAISRDITEQKAAEEALQESEARIRALLNATTNAMILIDSAGVVLAANNAHAEWIKKSIDEIIGKCIFDSFPPDIAEFRKAQTSVVFNTGKPIHFEESQNERIFNTSAYPVFGAKGKVTAVAVYAQDITERKQAEDALQESEEKLRSIAKQSGDGIVLADEQGNILEWNRGQERITGLSRAEVLGRPVWDIMIQVAANEHDNPALYGRIKAGVLKILETGQSGLDRMEAREVRRPDGVRRVIQVAVFPIKTGKGFMAGAISRDITEYKRAEYALRKSEEKYRALFDTAKDAIFVSDEAGNFVDVNQAACESLGYSREELLRLSIREIDADPTGYEAFLKVRDTPAKEAVFEVNQQRKDKTLLPVEITGKFFRIDGERLSLAIARDITERKAAEEQIKRSLREKDVFIHEIHHRVKNNLQVVSSLLSMQARTTRNKEAIDALSKSQSRINTMSLIHTQLYESGDLSELNMKEFIGELSEHLFRSYLVNDTKIARIVHVTDHKFPVSVGVHVGLIINELLSNALEHAFGERTSGTIKVSLTAPDSGRVNLRVSDDGAGLPPGFDINSTKTLGLHLVKMLVEDQLQGTLEVISDGGVTFNMEFDIEDNGGSSYGESKNTDR